MKIKIAIFGLSICIISLIASQLPEQAPPAALESSFLEASSNIGLEWSSLAESQKQHSPENRDDLAAEEAANQRASFVAEMRQRFAPHLHIKHAQIRSLDQLISYLKSKHPDDWQQHIQGLLAEMFPDMAAELYERYVSLDSYKNWLEENRDLLRRMPAQERRDALWTARYSAFGADADDIWQAQRRNEQFQDALAQAPQDLNTEQQLAHFTQALHSSYGEQAPALMQKRQSELVKRFLSQANVQQQLGELPAEQRQAQLRQVRQSLGMNDAALQRWQQLDSQRDAVWQHGQNYMQARAELTTHNEASDWQLRELRQQYFGEQAEQLAEEESAGFYRFAQARRYGWE